MLQVGVDDSLMELARQEIAAQKASNKRFRPLKVLKAKQSKEGPGVSLLQRPQRSPGTVHSPQSASASQCYGLGFTGRSSSHPHPMHKEQNNEAWRGVCARQTTVCRVVVCTNAVLPWRKNVKYGAVHTSTLKMNLEQVMYGVLCTSMPEMSHERLQGLLLSIDKHR